jgi:hypothetical protein
MAVTVHHMDISYGSYIIWIFHMAVGGSLNAGPPWGGSPNKCLMEMSISYFFHRAQSGQVIRSNGAWIILSKVTFCNFGNGRVPHIFNLSRATRTYGLFQQAKSFSSQRRSMHIHAPRRQATPRDEQQPTDTNASR